MQLKFIDQFLIKRTLNYNKNNKVNSLNKKNIYIFPTWFGFQLGFFLFFCLVASILYQNNFSLLIFIILFFIFFISILLTFQNLNNLDISTNSEIIVEQNTFQNLKIFVDNFDYTKKLNIIFKIEKQSLNSDIAKGVNKIEIIKKFYKRGVFDLPTLHCHTMFPFGIIKAWSYKKLNCKVFCYPKPISPPNNIQFYMDSFNINKNDEHFDFSHVEEYKHGDSLSKIAWKISSAKKKKFVKKFDSFEKNERILIDFDKIHPNLNFEKRLQYSVFLIFYCYEKGKEFAFKIFKNQTEFDNSKSHLEKILKKICYVNEY